MIKEKLKLLFHKGKLLLWVIPYTLAIFQTYQTIITWIGSRQSETFSPTVVLCIVTLLTAAVGVKMWGWACRNDIICSEIRPMRKTSIIALYFFAVSILLFLKLIPSKYYLNIAMTVIWLAATTVLLHYTFPKKKEEPYNRDEEQKARKRRDPEEELRKRREQEELRQQHMANLFKTGPKERRK